jgi:glycosyltransferase involved in cell wall biosynthesis
MLHKSTKISIVMASYNGEKYIQQQLDSLCHQTYRHFKLIISDDQSTDNTLSIIKKYQHKLNIQIIENKKNRGYNKNFERALRLVDTEYIALCDQDDIWHKDKLSLLLAHINHNTLIYANSSLIDEQGLSLNLSLSRKLKSHFISTRSALPFVYDNCVSGHAMLFKKELIPYIIPFPNTLFFDVWIALNAASLHGIHYFDQELVYYRQHSDGVIQQNKWHKKSNKLNKIDRKIKMHLQSSQQINEILQSKLLITEERKLLQLLAKAHQKFPNHWINFQLFSLLNHQKQKIFVITPKNTRSILKKYGLAELMYRYVPFI